MRPSVLLYGSFVLLMMAMISWHHAEDFVHSRPYSTGSFILMIMAMAIVLKEK